MMFMGVPNRNVRHVKRDKLRAVPLEVRSPKLGAPTLTVGQIVEHLGAVAPESAAALSERIRHWTREGLLVPVDQHHAGTGRRRRYSFDTSYEAAVLNAFASAGLHLVSRPYVQAALSHAKAVLQNWRQAISAGHKLPLFLLVISHEMTGGEPVVSIHEGVVKHDPTADIMVVVNLSQLFLGVLSRASQP
jgi:MerR HTH family regulatory protein